MERALSMRRSYLFVSARDPLAAAAEILEREVPLP